MRKPRGSNHLVWSVAVVLGGCPKPAPGPAPQEPPATPPSVSDLAFVEEADEFDNLPPPPDPLEDPELDDLPPPPEGVRPVAWATQVLRVLNGSRIDASITGVLHFQLVLCKDGTTKASAVDGTMSPHDQQMLVQTLDRLTVPPPPPKVLEHMKTPCAKIRYVFEWTPEGVR